MSRHFVVDPRFGFRMRALRQARGLSLRDLARPTLSSKSKLHNIETGATAPSPDTARLIDEALDAGGELVAMVQPIARANAAVERLAIGPQTDLLPSDILSTDQPNAHRLSARLRGALLAPRWPEDVELAVEDMLAVEAGVRRCHDAYQRADYAQAAALLPVVLMTAEHFARSGMGADSRRAHLAFALANLALSRLAAKVGDGSLGWVAADRAVSSALLSGDRALCGVAAGHVARALLKLPGRVDEAAHVLACANDELNRAATSADPVTVSVRGALLLLGAVVAARQRDRTAAVRQLTEAQTLAGGLGHDGNHLWTGFGPTNVLIHRVSVAVELQDPQRAIQVGDLIDTAQMPPALVSRRAQVHLDLATAFGQSRAGDPQAVLHLLEAERIAPQLLGVYHASRSLLTRLVDRERRAATPGLRGLAQRAGLLN